MISDGTYRARAFAFKRGESSTGTPNILVHFGISHGENAGWTVRWYGYLTEKSEQRTRDSLQTAGWDGIDIAVLDGLGSCECLIVVENEEYNGKEYCKVRWVNELKDDLPPIEPRNDDYGERHAKPDDDLPF